MSEKLSIPTSVMFSVRLYRLMLQVYPAAFRLEYGDSMTQVFRDSCLYVWRKNRPGSFLVLWSRTALDFFQTVIEQYTNRGIEMTLSKWIKLSGWGLLSSGLLYLMGWMASSRPAFSPYNAASWPVDRILNAAVTPLIISGSILSAAGFLGIYTRFKNQVKGLGKIGILLGLISSLAVLMGVIQLAVVDSGPWWEIMMIGFSGVFLGLILFGIDCLRLNLFTRWNILPLLTGLPWLVLFLVSLLYEKASGVSIPLPDFVILVAFLIAFGGLVLIGYRLQADTPWRGATLISE